MTLLPAPVLDPATLLFATAMMGFAMAGCAVGAMQAMPSRQPALRLWAGSMAASGLAFLLYFLRGQVPWLWSHVGANAAMLIGLGLAVQALARLVGAAPSCRVLTLACAWGLGGVAVSAATGLKHPAAAVTMSSAVAVLSLEFGRLLVRHPVARGLPAARYAALFALLVGVAFGWRTLMALEGHIALAALNQPQHEPASTGPLLVGGLFLGVASITFLSMAQELCRREVLEHARRDGLTGLLTRTAFFEAAGRLPADRTYAVAMVDIDHFKKVNDRHGHASGDVALMHLARLIANTARGQDLVGRYGGEEFCVLLQDCEAAPALRFGERLVEQARRSGVRLPDGGTLHCTLSVGVAVHTARAPDATAPWPEPLDRLLQRADAALYEAKAAGRDQARLHTPSPARPAAARLMPATPATAS